jgi:hypothetical protein
VRPEGLDRTEIPRHIMEHKYSVSYSQHPTIGFHAKPNELLLKPSQNCYFNRRINSEIGKALLR